MPSRRAYATSAEAVADSYFQLGGSFLDFCTRTGSKLTQLLKGICMFVALQVTTGHIAQDRRSGPEHHKHVPKIMQRTLTHLATRV